MPVMRGCAHDDPPRPEARADDARTRASFREHARARRRLATEHAAGAVGQTDAVFSHLLCDPPYVHPPNARHHSVARQTLLHRAQPASCGGKTAPASSD